MRTCSNKVVLSFVSKDGLHFTRAFTLDGKDNGNTDFISTLIMIRELMASCESHPLYVHSCFSIIGTFSAFIFVNHRI